MVSPSLSMSSTWRASASPALSTAASMVRAAVTRPESPGTTRYRRKGQPHEGDVVLAHLRRGYRFSSRFRFLYGTVKPRGHPGSAAKSWSTALVQKQKLRLVNR